MTRPLPSCATPSREHVAFLKSFVDTCRFGDYLFVHAGIRPGVPIEDQAQSDLRWIREPFLLDETDHGLVVVHGHTISEEVDQRPNRIGIDTGAYRTGVLTALAIEGQERWLIEAGRVQRLGLANCFRWGSGIVLAVPSCPFRIVARSVRERSCF